MASELSSRDQRILESVSNEFALERGKPLPLGASFQRHGVNFALFSNSASWVNLVLFHADSAEPIVEFPLDPHINRTGDVWHILIIGIDPGIHYGFRLGKESDAHPQIHRFDPDYVVLDPYAKAIVGRVHWNAPLQEGVDHPLQTGVRRSVVVDDQFDWAHDQPLNIPLSESIIYEMHVRGFTRDDSAAVNAPGTFAGLIEKIPYLQSLGITAVELLPVNEFEEADSIRTNPETGEALLNYWGYHSLSFFAPKSSFAHAKEDGAAVVEFKRMVKALHEAGIEVILDIVFNHTGEGDQRGVGSSFRSIDNNVYYIIDPETGEYHNYSGCGNTLNCNHPVVRDLILDCLRYWVMEMHVDGFRFDLASILGRGQDGSVLSNPPLLERIAADPVLANTKLIAEAWDAAGLYQVGSFPSWGRWAEWNGQYRDDIRQYVRGEPGMIKALATRLSGSADLYHHSERKPFHSINFITCHDGFTMADLVAYNDKHNASNGELNRDGCNDNYSWNCGVEGDTGDAAVNALRLQQIKNCLLLLVISNGVPMILSGDECGRSQHGNNNPYCQDNTLSWFDWGLLERNSELLEFTRQLIAFRRSNPILSREEYVQDANTNESAVQLIWHGTEPHNPDWSDDSRALGMQLLGPEEIAGDRHILLLTNAFWEPLEFRLPEVSGCRWYTQADTSESNSFPLEPVDAGAFYQVSARSTILLVGR